jgi:hypothetical protein
VLVKRHPKRQTKPQHENIGLARHYDITWMLMAIIMTMLLVHELHGAIFMKIDRFYDVIL